MFMAKNADASPNQPIERIIQRIEQTSTVLGDKASLLSGVIADIDRRLCAMPGKVEAYAEHEGVRVSYYRAPEWGVWLTDDESEYDNGESVAEDITRVTVARKARAFPALLKLLERIEAAQERQLSEVTSALGLLQSEGK
jgi:hypothetical protein